MSVAELIDRQEEPAVYPLDACEPSPSRISAVGRFRRPITSEIRVVDDALVARRDLERVLRREAVHLAKDRSSNAVVLAPPSRWVGRSHV